MSRIQDAWRKALWDQFAEHGMEGFRKARDTRLVAMWFRKGKIESTHLDALDWLQRRVEASHARGVAGGERVACSRSPDGPTAAQMDALNDVAGAMAAVRTRAGHLCERALYVLTADPQVYAAELERELGARRDRMFAIVLQALDTLAAYRDECVIERAKWNRRAFVP